MNPKKPKEISRKVALAILYKHLNSLPNEALGEVITDAMNDNFEYTVIKNNYGDHKQR